MLLRFGSRFLGTSDCLHPLCTSVFMPLEAEQVMGLCLSSAILLVFRILKIQILPRLGSSQTEPGTEQEACVSPQAVARFLDCVDSRLCPPKWTCSGLELVSCKNPV